MKTVYHQYLLKYSKWLFISLVAMVATVAFFSSNPLNSKAADNAFDLNNMRWGLVPATDGSNGSSPVYSSLDGYGSPDASDWVPSPNGSHNIGSNDASLLQPYMEGTENPHTVVGNIGGLSDPSDAKIGDKIIPGDYGNPVKPDPSKIFTVTGFRMGANKSLMTQAGDRDYSDSGLSPESPYFHFDVQEVDRQGNNVSNNPLYVYQNSTGYQWSTILGFEKMDKNDLAKVTITPANTDQGKHFTGSQTLYFSLKKVAEANARYGFYSSNGNINNFVNMKSNTAQSPIAVSMPNDGKIYLDDTNNPTATWTTDNPKLTATKDPSRDGYQIANLNSLTPGTVVKFTIHYSDGSTADYYLKFGTSSTSGGSSTGTPTTTPAATITPATNVPTNSSSSDQNSSSTTTTTTTTKPSTSVGPNIAVKGEAVYATKKIALYKNTSFTKANRMAWYPKQKRVNRPMFVVTGYSRAANGVLRYKVRDVNHGRKTAGKTGYITASHKYVVPVYYAGIPKSERITVISPKGVNAYKSANLTGKAKHYKKGIRLTVTKLVKHNLTTRYQLSNGHFVTANKKLIIAGNY
ncbi:MAG: DUF5776 domain-containing protein [Liquorilactobacillus satsumensis]